MPNPLAEALAAAKADAANQPDGATQSAWIPTDANMANVHIQVAWDGTPSDADNREDAALRFTVWAPRGQVSLAIDEAGGLRARLLDAEGANLWRMDRGSGRLAGTDATTGLPFCTFTLNAALHALRP